MGIYVKDFAVYNIIHSAKATSLEISLLTTLMDGLCTKSCSNDRNSQWSAVTSALF